VTGQGENKSEYQFATTRKTIDKNNSRNGGSRKKSGGSGKRMGRAVCTAAAVFFGRTEGRRGSKKDVMKGEKSAREAMMICISSRFTSASRHTATPAHRTAHDISLSHRCAAGRVYARATTNTRWKRQTLRRLA
jgi:hypothetical protein